MKFYTGVKVIMSSNMQPVRGTKDFFGQDIAKYNHIVSTAKDITANYGYQELITPIFEFTNLFSRSLGEASDVVSKEMYNLLDKNGESLTLRPEFTASIVRSFLSNGMQQHLPLKFFSHGPLFRYERPQKGRMRQFHQVNAEFIGVSDPGSDAEIIQLACDLLDKLDILSRTELHLNSLGDKESRLKYREVLIAYFSKYESELSQDSQIRLKKNPLRILDSKDETDRNISLDAPKITDILNDTSRKYFADLQEYLTKMKIDFRLNTSLVRGLDYYTHTCFEFVTDALGAQGTVLGGGRYDGLIEELGGSQVPAIGFAAGIERLSLMIQDIDNLQQPVFISYIDESLKSLALETANILRKNNIYTEIDFTGNFSKQLKRANKLKARFVVIIGEDEVNNNNYKLKNFDTAEERSVSLNELIEIVKK